MIRQIFRHKLIVILSLFICFLISESHALNFPNSNQAINFSIAENSPEGTVVGNVRVENNPANVNYGILQEFNEYPDYNYFTIVRNGTDRGQIKVKIPPDYEDKSLLKIKVGAATDGSGKALEASVAVNITVIDDTMESANSPPEFLEGDSTTRFVNPFTQFPGSFGQAISATDSDASDTIEYYISQDQYGNFSIDADTGILSNSIPSVLSARWLGGTVKRVYNIVVGVRDNHNSSDYINVSVIMDGPPEFTEPVPIKRSIMEGLASGTAVGEPISVRDLDGDKITFSFSRSILKFGQYYRFHAALSKGRDVSS